MVTYLFLFGLWCVLSGQFDAFHLGLGALACLMITAFSKRLLFQDEKISLTSRMAEGWRFIFYLFWLLKEIVLANLHVLYLACHPRMQEVVDPKIIRFTTLLKKDFSRFVFANSITITPGTVTVQVNGNEFVVHAISHKMASGLPGEMEERIQRVFEPKQNEGAD